MRLMVIAPFHVPGLDGEQKNVGDLLTAEEDVAVRKPDNLHLLQSNCTQISDDAAKVIDEANAARNPAPAAAAPTTNAAPLNAPASSLVDAPTAPEKAAADAKEAPEHN